MTNRDANILLISFILLILSMVILMYAEEYEKTHQQINSPLKITITL